MPSVDIVVPCYNYAHFLDGCVASILSQRGVEVRILIINDASPDQTEQVGQALAASDPRVTYHRNDQNLGLIGTANRGILEWAEADYVLLLSADDLLTPGSLARACGIMQKHQDVHMVFGQALLIDDHFDPSQLPVDETETEYQLLKGPAFIQRNFTHRNPVPSPTAVLRTEVQQRLGGYLPQFHHTSDMEMWMRFAAQGPIGVIRNLQAGYRIHDASMSAPKFVRAISDREECLETCEFVVENWCADVPEAQTWLTQMRRKMARESYWLANQPRYSKDQRRDCATFAARIDPDGPVSISRLKYEIKKRLGWLGLLSGKPVGADADPVTSGIYGWWPGDA